MKKTLMVCALMLGGAVLFFKHVDGSPRRPHSSGHENYAEECQGEGCNSEEVSELCSSYTEECVGEGCSKEEIIELAGNPGSVSAMLQDFERRGCKVRQQDFAAANCTGIKSDTQCAAVTLWCKDFYHCADGNIETSWYICGGCFGFGGGTKEGNGGGGCSIGS